MAVVLQPITASLVPFDATLVDQIVVPVTFDLTKAVIEPVIVKSGQDHELLFQFRKKDGSVIDCSAATFTLTIKKAMYLKRITLQFSGIDFDVTDAVNGNIPLAIGGSLLLIEERSYYAELKVVFPEFPVSMKSETFRFIVEMSLTT